MSESQHLNIIEHFHIFCTPLQEIQALAQLKHPYILPFQGPGLSDLTAKDTLRQRIDRSSPGDFSLAKIQHMLNQIGLALDYAHQHKIVHADLQPEHILFNSAGDALLTGFAGTLSIDPLLTPAHAAGMPLSKAPELLAGKPTSFLSDQYALGCLARELLTLSDACPPWYIELAVRKALAQEPHQRHRDVREFIKALDTPRISPGNYQHIQREWEEEAHAHCKKQRYHEALACYERMLLLTDQTADIYRNMADVYCEQARIDCEQGRYNETLAALQQALCFVPEDISILLNYANLLYRLYQEQRTRTAEEVLSAYERILDLKPDQPDALKRQIELLYCFYRYHEVLVASEKALERAPNDPGIADYQAGSLLALAEISDDDDKALAYLKRMLALEPANLASTGAVPGPEVQMRRELYAKAYWKTGGILKTLKRRDEALAAYEQAIQLGIDDLFFWIERGDLLLDQGGFTINRYKFLKKRGKLPHQQKYCEQALESYKRAEKHLPEDRREESEMRWWVRVLQGQANALRALGHKDKVDEANELQWVIHDLLPD
ncbi:MAG TPA: protein kinase [Ktedonobacteraceae bacterium]